MLLDILANVNHTERAIVVIVATLGIWAIIDLVRLYIKRPTNITIGGPTVLLGKWLSTLDFMFRAAPNILSLYRRNGRLPFALPAFTEYQVLISSPEQIHEMVKLPKTALSFHAAMDDRLHYKHTMYGFEPNEAIDPHDSVPIHALKVLLRSNLNVLGPVIYTRVEEAVDGMLKDSSSEPFHSTTRVSVFALARAISGRVNNQILFGSELATNQSFNNLTSRYALDGAIAMEVCRLLPRSISGFVCGVLMGWSGCMSRVGANVTGLVEQRLNAHEKGRDAEYLDLTQFVILASRTPRQRNPTRVVQQMVALLFASAHQLPMALAWAIIMLSTRPECVELLRDEITRVQNEEHEDPLKEMRILDSFLRESSRLNPLDGLSIQRKALQPITLYDGTHIPAGNLVAVPQGAIMRDPDNYLGADHFNILRFYSPPPNMDEQHDSANGNPSSPPPQTRYTDVNWRYPFWGSPNHACPGRWYASVVLKHAIIHLVTNYEFQLAEETNLASNNGIWRKLSGIIGRWGVYTDKKASCEPFVWTTALPPRFSTQIELRHRPESKGRS